MTAPVTFLHVTDPHIAESRTELPRDDFKKPNVRGIEQDTRENALERTFARLAEHLREAGRTLTGVLFTGDAQDRGRPGGHDAVREMLLYHFECLGVRTDNIVAVPGNHDVPKTSEPSTEERYRDFIAAWRAKGCITPWLDGVDDDPSPSKHFLAADDHSWVIFPMNSCNWAHAPLELEDPLRTVWKQILDKFAQSDPKEQAKLETQLNDLVRYDMARVSPEQLEFLRKTIREIVRPDHGVQIRVALIHHHLRAPSVREEIKSGGADFTNLQMLRAFLGERQINIVLHGHKHEAAAYFDYIDHPFTGKTHRTLIIAGATFGPGHEDDAVRLVTLEGIPSTPEVRIEPVSLPRAGFDARVGSPTIRKLWNADEFLPGAPVIVQGTDITQVHARACAVVRDRSNGNTVIVHLDLPSSASIIPAPSGMDEAWLKELVGWWQGPRSQLEHRIPYLHGVRLRRFGGKINQINRIVNLLRASNTTRALAVLVDPFLDFGDGRSKEEFASFCIVQFRKRERFLDCVAYYRAQEFERWWPVNVAELRQLQAEIGQPLSLSPGRITTIAADARTRASRSPTQVAMPIIDRWLDQAPEKIHVLANALVAGSADAPEKSIATDWIHSLEDQLAAAKEFNEDGIPVAIEGLETLASYLVVNGQSDHSTKIDQLVTALRGLANHNRMWETSGRDHKSFLTWSPNAQNFINTLLCMSEERLQSEHRDQS
jgi:3',5'-cyclic AMP phosphodiesterase CpdA